MQSRPPVVRCARTITAAALTVLFLTHLFAAYVTRHRAADHDEMQYLHVGWLMAQGERLYLDFAEDHSPFLFVILESLVPPGGTESMPSLDVLSYVARARAVTSACGVMALACVALLTFRATRSLLAPLITTATLLGSNWFWHRGLTDARNDPPGLFLFWMGTLLLIAPWQTERKRALLAGTGIGLAVAAALWNPKMPFECIVLGAIYLWRLKEALVTGLRMVIMTVIPAAAIAAVAVLIVVDTVSLYDYFFFTFRYNVVIAELSREVLRELPPFVYCDPAFKGIWPMLALGTMGGILFVPGIRRQMRELDLRCSAIVFALAIAAVLDILFLFPYPAVLTQYYLMWDIAVAAVYGVIVAVALRMLGRARLEAAVQITVAVLAVVIVGQALPLNAGSPSWHGVSYMQKRLRRGETVWVDAKVHPIAARDASYYWFAFDIVPASVRHAAAHPGRSPLPIVQQDELPICRAERGLEPNLRFVSGRTELGALPVTLQCLERMIASGRAVQTPVRDVWDLRPPLPER